MKYFTKEYIQFFEELELNNNKEWFARNRKRYEQYVKEPLTHFVTDVVAELQKLDPYIDNDPKKFIKRINKDVRFSKDKTPYNIRSFVHIYKGDKMDPITAVAFQIGARNMAIMNGYYMPTTERLHHIRDKIQAELPNFKKLISAKDFNEKYSEIKGEANKRIPPKYHETFKQEPLIANKQFYFMREFGTDLIFSDKLLPIVLEYYKAGKPLNDFFA
jgi:uncharacterized protein (TIGR02453 family)